MFERYTESARRAIFFARYEVSELGGLSIAPEHLMLGLLRSPTPAVTEIMRAASIAPSELREEIRHRLTVENPVAASVEIPFSEDAKRALRYTAEEADRLDHRFIGTEHLLLALLRDERSEVSAMLTSRGLRLQATRGRVLELLSASPQPAPPDPGVVEFVSPHGTLPSNLDEVVTHILEIQRLFEQFARDAVNRGAPADSAQAILAEFEALKRRLEGERDQ